MAETVGELLHRHRVAAGMTQKDLAGRAGVSVRALRDIERGRIHRPQASTVARLATTLALPDDESQRLIAAHGAAAADRRAGVRIHVLGRLTVQRDGAPVALAEGKAPTLLGLLAVQVNQTVSADEIADVLWGSQPPPTWPDLIHTYVARLRRLLTPSGSRSTRVALISRAGRGYILRADAERLDLVRFDDLAGLARKADEPKHAFDVYTEALRCWRGPVLAGAEPRLQLHPAVVGAGRRRVDVTTAFADLALALGRYEEAEDALRGLLETQTLDEGLHARMILALSGSGRRAAALDLFAGVRRRLADELGIGPGERLQAAHLKVLREDPGHDGTPRAGGATAVDMTAPGPSEVPRQLPAATPHFVGRTAELAELERLAEQSNEPGAPVIAAIDGTAGIGKTALAIAWAHRIAPRFPDGQLFVNLRGFDSDRPPMPPREAIRVLLEGLAVPADRLPSTIEGQVGLYRSILADRRMLVVLDDASDSDHVRHLVPGGRGCLVMVTSRTQLTGLIAEHGARLLTLDLLSPPEAIEALTRHVGLQRVRPQAEAAAALAELCAGLPLAVTLAGAQLAAHPSFPLGALVADLVDGRNRLDALDSVDVTGRVRPVLASSYLALAPPVRRMFRLLGLHPGRDVTPAIAASLAGVDTAGAGRALRELARAHLVAEPFPGRFAMHDLLRLYATELSHAEDPDHERRAAQRRILEHYVHSAYAAERLLSPNRTPIALSDLPTGVVAHSPVTTDDALRWFATERAALLAALDLAVETGFDRHACQLGWAVTTYLDRHGLWQHWVAAQTAALTAARRTDDPTEEARILSRRAAASGKLGRYDDADADLRAALGLFDKTGEPIDRGHVHTNLAWLRNSQDRHEDALGHLRQALTHYRTARYRTGQGRVLNAIGWYHAQQRSYREALKYCTRALALQRRNSDGAGRAATFDSLGHINRHLGDLPTAAAHYEEAAKLRRELGDRHLEAATLLHLSEIYATMDQPDKARVARQRATELSPRATPGRPG
jgi:DNA-binding SARP family transcriptional activator/Tfp pilus assembly protein PilF/DNA-binding XRE family transcriptional regulator